MREIINKALEKEKSMCVSIEWHASGPGSSNAIAALICTPTATSTLLPILVIALLTLGQALVTVPLAFGCGSKAHARKMELKKQFQKPQTTL